MSAHTPGPWLTEFSEAYVVRAQQDGGRVAIIANLRGPHGMGGRRSSAEVAANTRLIAAVPDLLEALEGYVTTIAAAGGGDKALFMAAIREADNKARAAIAKATGAQP